MSCNCKTNENLENDNKKRSSVVNIVINVLFFLLATIIVIPFSIGFTIYFLFKLIVLKNNELDINWLITNMFKTLYNKNENDLKVYTDTTD